MIEKLFIAGVAATGAVMLVTTVSGLPVEMAPALTLLVVLCLAAQRMPVSLFARSSVSVGVAFSFTGLLLLGPAAAILINIPSMVLHGVYPRRRPLRKVIFNLGLVSVAAGAGGLLYEAIGGAVPVESYPAAIMPMAVAALGYFLIQSLGVTTILVLSEGGSFAQVWQGNYRWLAANYLAMAGISIGMALAYRGMGPVGLLFFSLPLAMAWYSFRLYTTKSKEVQSQTEILKSTNSRLEDSLGSTIRALAAAANTKDHYTYDHSEAAMRYSAEAAQRLGLDARSVVAVQLGALFHDIGKIGVPDAMLHKATVLTAEEWEIMRQHPVLGAQVVQEVSGLQEVVPAILHHHERYDGAGYPDGLRGAQIPLTAQIVAVVDAYQAMTSDRPYRRALTHEQAVQELRRNAGTQFNPVVVEAFGVAREAARRTGEQVWPAVDLSALLCAPQPAPAKVRA